jgi:hypothetical protein
MRRVNHVARNLITLVRWTNFTIRYKIAMNLFTVTIPTMDYPEPVLLTKPQLNFDPILMLALTNKPKLISNKG